MKTFTYDIAIAGGGSGEYPVKRVQFGEGYEQRQPQGITPILEKWQVSHEGTKVDVDAIKAFLDEHAGITPFLWRVTSDEPLKKYVASSYSRVPKGGSKWRISWEMREVLA